MTPSAALIENLEQRQMLSAAVSKLVGPLLTTSSATASSATVSAVTGKTGNKISNVISLPSTDVKNNREAGKAYTQYQRLNGGNPVALPSDDVSPNAATYSPAQIRAAYGVDNIVFGAVTGDGSGQTIAIVDAYDNRSMVSSSATNWTSSDLYRFSQAFGLNTNFTFTKLDQTGGTSYPAYNQGWAGEIALDVEWAHAMAPKANIVLVEASSSSTSALYTAVNTAKALSGVTAVSMSYGINGTSQSGVDSTYSRVGVSFFASTGDAGAPGGYPSFSPNVVAVGGTTLNTSGSAYASESGWSGSGGGISSVYGKPAYQNLVTTPSTTQRTIPDVSMDADPNTGVYVLDTSPAGIGTTAAYYAVGGTSLSAPLWAGLSAVVNQGRATVGIQPLTGNSQALSSTNMTGTLQKIYQLSSSDFHDITSGSNGYSAAAGYDLVTGRGSPIANTLVRDLAGGVTISGTIFADFNGNNVADAGETRYSGQTVYLDYNNNGTLDSAYEPSTTTAADGTYSFIDQVGGRTFVVRTSATTPANSVALTSSALTTGTSAYATAISNQNFRFFPTAYTGTAFTLNTDASGTNAQIFASSTASGTPAYSVNKGLISSLSFTGTAGNDSFNIDLTNGSPIPASGVSINGNGGTDSLTVTGSANADTVTANAASLTLNGAAALSYSSIASLVFNLDGGNDTLNFASPSATVTFNPGTGSDTLNVQSGTYTASTDLSNNSASSLGVNVSNGGTIVFNSTQHLASLSLASGAKASVGTNGSRVLVLNSLSLVGTGTLDLNDNDAIVRDPNAFATLTAAVKSARDNGFWDGNGITSSSAKPAQTTDPVKPTGLGLLSGADYSSIIASNTTFDGEVFNQTDTLIKYTYNGDITFDGKVDANDYSRIDSAFVTQNNGNFIAKWFTGDLNFDGKIDANDYSLIDAAYTTQTNLL